MSFLDNLKAKFHSKSYEEETKSIMDMEDEETDEEEAEKEELNRLNLNLDDTSEIASGDESAPEDEAVSLKSKLLSIVMGIIALTVVSIVINNVIKNNNSVKTETSENTINIPDVNVSPAALLPDKYTEIPKIKQKEEEKKIEEPALPVQPEIVQEIPQISEEDRTAEREYREQLAKVLASSISFGKNNNEAKASETPIIANRQIKQIDSYMTGFTLSAGAIIPATMITGATSDMPNADVVAQVRQDVYDSKTGKHLLIPQGAKLIGTSTTAGERGNKRLGVIINRINFPNGTYYVIPNMNATDGPGTPGLKDQYTQHSGQMIRSAALSAIFAAIAQSATKSSGGYDYTQSAGDEAVKGALASVMDTANTIIQRDANIAPTINIRPGLQFNLFINKDIVFKDYMYEKNK